VVKHVTVLEVEPTSLVRVPVEMVDSSGREEARSSLETVHDVASLEQVLRQVDRLAPVTPVINGVRGTGISRGPWIPWRTRCERQVGNPKALAGAPAAAASRPGQVVTAGPVRADAVGAATGLAGSDSWQALGIT